MMIWSDYWGALNSRQRYGLLASLAVVLALTIAVGMWAVRDPYVMLAAQQPGDQTDDIVQVLDRSKVQYRLADGGEITVPRSQLGRARAALSSGPSAVPPAVGLELFKDLDFTTTDFAQKIHYQRALQGEIARTLQNIDGVKKVRVHVVLPEGGLLKRGQARPTAAITLALQPGKRLTRGQVSGIQRLVMASVPEMKADDVVLLDEEGTSLTRPGAPEGQSDVSWAPLELKQQADLYLESKVQRLLSDLTPMGSVSVSVDVELTDKQQRVTIEEPLAAAGAKDAERPAGVLTKERQTQRSRPPGAVTPGAPDSPEAEVSDWEYDYKVGHRIEQTLAAPGAIKRVNVAVALTGTPRNLTNSAVEQLVSHAVGVDKARGDSVAVLLLAPASQPDTVNLGPLPPAKVSESASAGRSSAADHEVKSDDQLAKTGGLAVLALFSIAAVVLATRSRRRLGGVPDASPADMDAMTRQVRQWLGEGASNDRS